MLNPGVVGRGKHLVPPHSQPWPDVFPPNPLARGPCPPSHYILHTTYYTLHTTHFDLHTTLYTLHSKHYKLQTTDYRLQTTQAPRCTPLRAVARRFCSGSSSHYTLHTTHYTPHSTHYTSTSVHPTRSRCKALLLRIRLDGVGFG